MPKFNGGVYFFKKGDTAAAVFKAADAVGQGAKEIGIIDFDKAGPGEETLIGLAPASLGLQNF